MLLEENNYIIQEHLTLKNVNFQIQRSQEMPDLIDDDRSTLRHIIMECHNTQNELWRAFLKVTFEDYGMRIALDILQ